MNNPDSPETKAVSQIRVRALLFLILAVAAGGGAVLLFKQYLDGIRGAGAGSPTDTVPVVIAAVDVPIATRLEEPHVTVVQWPAAHVPEGAFDSTQEVIDRTLQTSVLKGEPILVERLADEKEGRGLAALLADGMRAMAVKVDSSVGVAGFVQPGDYVDVLVTMTPDEETDESRGDNPARISKIILQNILVLAVGEHLSHQGSKPVPVKVVTLGVTADESEKLALASQYGRITLTMRSRVDQKIAATAGITPLHLLQPDEGADDPQRQLVEPEKPRQTLRTRRRVRRRPAPAPEEKKPAPPVVEILRGSKVEERKLRVPGE
ncbi:MAG: Flp pilus assembly protein CpaB [Myxococcales bacterium]